jgi:hypothetical protein
LLVLLAPRKILSLLLVRFSSSLHIPTEYIRLLCSLSLLSLYPSLLLALSLPEIVSLSLPTEWRPRTRLPTECVGIKPKRAHAIVMGGTAADDRREQLLVASVKAFFGYSKEKQDLRIHQVRLQIRRHASQMSALLTASV